MTVADHVLDLTAIDRTRIADVGGKGANLGELARVAASDARSGKPPRASDARSGKPPLGIAVPPGFCVTTAAYRAAVRVDLAPLDGLRATDKAIAAASARLRAEIEATPIPDAIAADITARITDGVPYAVRSSATAEDLPDSSFAGQQDTYLNVTGAAAILDAVRSCWASLFTERAVAYRIQNGFAHRDVELAVVVQQMVFPEAAGIMFTADPITSDRLTISIDAGFGLGEGLVSGLVNADTYRIKDGELVERRIATQATELRAAAGGGTEERALAPEKQGAQVLSDARIAELAALGRRIEQHFGAPQDIEWGLVDGAFQILQSRPITTLYPVPDSSDGKLHVYMSYGHRQMMTDAFHPLGLSFFLLLDEWLGRPKMTVAGGRFYKDMSFELSSPFTRQVTLRSLGQVDTLMANALRAVAGRKDLARGKAKVMSFGKGGPLPMARQFLRLRRTDDPGVVPELIAENERSVERLRQEIAGKTGEELFAFIVADHRTLTDIMFEPRSVAAAFVGIHAANWLNSHVEKWLGEQKAADALAQAADHNVVAAMGLELLDVADVVRRHPVAIDHLERGGPLTELDAPEVVEAIEGYLRRFGMHCSGDIDFARTRWAEDPTLLYPLILGNVRNFGPGSHAARQEEGRRATAAKRDELLARLSGRRRRRVAKHVSLLRHFIGYREYSKHACLQRYWLYKQALLGEAEKLVAQGRFARADDMNFLTFDEFRIGRFDAALIAARRAELAANQKLTPPRVITSQGEVPAGTYTASIPAGALPGVAVSAGVAEGRARVVLALEDATVEEGDILVARYTDPSWSALFVGVEAVVMEVGGVMTHGAVVAREYGLPSVVGVENATTTIRDGARIRVDGAAGYVEVLEP